MNAEHRIHIKQIQIEQDTGKSTYVDEMANIDLNRANHCLIEMVTEPDIKTPETAGIFVKKLQMLLRHLQVCSGELESGAMRVDVNVSVNWGQRCEIKNLSSVSAVVHAIKAEFRRQVQDIQNGVPVESETRGWDGRNTWKLRGKEGIVDYRYMPDPELVPVTISSHVLDTVKSQLPVLPDDIFVQLLDGPFNVPLKDARTLMSIDGLAQYYKDVYQYVQDHDGRTSIVANWVVHVLLGELNNADGAEASGIEDTITFSNIIPANKLGDLINLISKQSLTNASAKLVLKHFISNPVISSNQSVQQVVEQYDLSKAEAGQSDVQEALAALCQQVIQDHPEISEQIRSGKKPKSVQFLIGQVMRQSQGRVDPQAVKNALLKALK